MSKIIGLDPGTDHGAYVVWCEEKHQIVEFQDLPNEQLLEFLRTQTITKDVVVEVIRGYGMNVGNETFDTCMFTGQIKEICRYRNLDFTGVGRKDIVKAHCGSTSAGDSEVRAVLVQKVGPPGTKKKPGPTYGIVKHLWSALAVATGIIQIRKDAEYFKIVQDRNAKLPK